MKENDISYIARGDIYNVYDNLARVYCKLGLLVNFNTNDITKGIFRKVNGL